MARKRGFPLWGSHIKKKKNFSTNSQTLRALLKNAGYPIIQIEKLLVIKLKHLKIVQDIVYNIRVYYNSV